MPNANIIVYISENNPDCESVLQLIKEFEIPYEVRNITENTEYRRELQDLNIYGTPATFIKENDVILGAQINRIKRELRLIG